jgi:hypothetical protein
LEVTLNGTHADFHPAMAGLDKREELVDGEEVRHAIAELLGHVAGVVAERP